MRCMVVRQKCNLGRNATQHNPTSHVDDCSLVRGFQAAKAVKEHLEHRVVVCEGDLRVRTHDIHMI